MYCTNCGKPNPDDAQFCSSCGSSITTASVNIPPNPVNPNTIPEENALSIFVGSKSESYIRKWETMQASNIKAGWNWAAFFFSFWWLAYRRMYLYAIGAFVSWILLVVAFKTFNGYAISSIISWYIIALATGIFGNYIYFKYANSKISAIKTRNLGASESRELASAGGTSVGLVIILILLSTGYNLYGAATTNSSGDSIKLKITELEEQIDYAMPFSEGMAMVVKDDKIGYIDIYGKMVIPNEFDILPTSGLYDGYFSEGLAPVYKDYKWGYIDKSGQLVIPYQYNGVYPFSEGVAFVRSYKDGLHEQNKFIDKTGKMQIPCKFDGALSFSDGLALVWQSDRTGTKHGYIDKSGRLVIPCQFEGASPFSEGIASVEKDEKRGYIDKSGHLVIPYQFDAAYCFSEGLAAVGKGRYDDSRYNFIGHWGYIDKNGQLVIPYQFSNVNSFSEGLAVVTQGDYTDPNRKYGYIDINGKLVIPYQYDNATDFRDGRALVEKNGKWEIIEIDKGMQFNKEYVNKVINSFKKDIDSIIVSTIPTSMDTDSAKYEGKNWADIPLSIDDRQYIIDLVSKWNYPERFIEDCDPILDIYFKRDELPPDFLERLDKALVATQETKQLKPTPRYQKAHKLIINIMELYEQSITLVKTLYYTDSHQKRVPLIKEIKQISESEAMDIVSAAWTDEAKRVTPENTTWTVEEFILGSAQSGNPGSSADNYDDEYTIAMKLLQKKINEGYIYLDSTLEFIKREIVTDIKYWPTTTGESLLNHEMFMYAPIGANGVYYCIDNTTGKVYEQAERIMEDSYIYYVLSEMERR